MTPTTAQLEELRLLIDLLTIPATIGAAVIAFAILHGLRATAQWLLTHKPIRESAATAAALAAISLDHAKKRRRTQS